MIDYVHNSEAEQFADILIPDYHPHLTGIKIAFLSKVKPATKKKKNPKPPRRGKKVTMAKASKVSAKTNALVGKDYKFLIEFDDAIWQELSDDKKLALVDHELCHCGNDADGCYMIAHDLEDFRAIMTRHGFWMPDVVLFAETIENVIHADEVATEEMNKIPEQGADVIE